MPTSNPHSTVARDDRGMTAAKLDAERVDLLHALERYCVCEHDNGRLYRVCPGHEALTHPMFIRHLEFGRTLAARSVAEEFCLHPSRTDDECDVCGDIRLTSEFGFQTLKALDRAA